MGIRAFTLLLGGLALTAGGQPAHRTLAARWATYGKSPQYWEIEMTDPRGIAKVEAWLVANQNALRQAYPQARHLFKEAEGISQKPLAEVIEWMRKGWPPIQQAHQSTTLNREYELTLHENGQTKSVRVYQIADTQTLEMPLPFAATDQLEQLLKTFGKRTKRSGRPKLLSLCSLFNGPPFSQECVEFMAQEKPVLDDTGEVICSALEADILKLACYRAVQGKRIQTVAGRFCDQMLRYGDELTAECLAEVAGKIYPTHALRDCQKPDSGSARLACLKNIPSLGKNVADPAGVVGRQVPGK